MAVFKCKMCGGTVEFEPGATVGVCDSCGTKQTLPRLDDDRRANLYDRANHFRRNNDFDKAAGLYEQILNEDNTDAEAYWSLVLCRYGIEYVEDPATHRRVPTVNRAQFTSVFDDDNYKSAIQYADLAQRQLYEEEARTINEIQKGILSISQKEEPFDVFICYKETDAGGRRTPDSVLANDLYYQLTQEGFKVFFARITLEDKLGTAYEPYIFAALNSARVMVVLGTRPEYFNAVWVKNEWSRYLALVKTSGGKKVLIPAYKDMDPYDLPEEFSHLQAQDMSKLGFMQDLIRGIRKIAQAEEPKTTMVRETVVTGGGTNTASLLKRAFMFLEDGNWTAADEYCEKVLDAEPECAEAYLGKLMAELHVRNKAGLKYQKEPFDWNNNYRKAIRYGSDELKKNLADWTEQIETRNETARRQSIYDTAAKAMNEADTEEAYQSAADAFAGIPGFKDADTLAQQCREKAEICRKNAIYASAMAEMEDDTIESCGAAIEIFQSIPGWKDADGQILACRRRIEEIKAKEEADRLEAERRAKQRKKITIIVTPIVCAVIALAITVIIPNAKYNNAVALMDAGNIVEAYETFLSLDGYKDSADKADSVRDKYKTEKIKSAKVGDYVFFGAYEQDNDTSNGKEDIEWLVLEVKDGKVLLISRYALDSKPYNTRYTDITWETCSLREWLNNDFIDSAFSAKEQAMIPTVAVSADKNPKYDTYPGGATQDKVFLLSIAEANKYFRSDSARQCEPTQYATANGAYADSDNGCWWWLRSPGAHQDYAAGVHYFGSVHCIGDLVGDVSVAARPALWINLDS